MVDVLYSLVDVHERFDRLALDSLYIRHLDFMFKPLFKQYSSSIVDQILDRICKKILPRICNNVYKLTVEPFSLERILGVGNYPQLHSLSLNYFTAGKLLSQLTGDTILVRLLNHQITEVCINSCINTDKSTDRRKLEVFAMILSVCKQLRDLTISEYTCFLKNISNFNPPRASCTSSTLTKLNIHVHSFDDCLYLLDGRFECLSILIINIMAVIDSLSNRDNKKKLPKLKYFSLSTSYYASYYDEQIAPLLRRMSDLEELTLFFMVKRLNSTFIDGKQLYNDFLIYMTQLQKFSFRIHTVLMNKDVGIKLPSSNDLRLSFLELGYEHIDAFSDVDFVYHRAAAHIYSLPYQFETFDFMTSAFQGGKFDQVRILCMYDRRPFEHRLFEIIARDFPFLQRLLVSNWEEQQVKDHSGELIKFSHLCQLGLLNAHVDYAMEFLSYGNISLPRLTSLSIKYEVLATVTNNFTNNQARLICNRITDLEMYEPFVRPNNFDLYFPLARTAHFKKPLFY